MTDMPKFVREVRATWLTLKDIEEQYGVSARVIRRLMEKGAVRSFWLDGRYMIDPATIDAGLESRSPKVEVNTTT